MKKTSVLLLAFASLCCFAGVFDAKSFVLHDGAVVENGILKLDGKKAYATIPGTEKISFAAPGVTFACAVKPAFDARKGSGEMMDSYFSRNRAPFTICRWGGLISTRIVNKKTGKYQIDRVYGIPKAGVWSHIAFVITPVKNKADNWNIAMYLNGKKIYDKIVADFTPDSGKGAIELGKGWGDAWMFTGEMTAVFVEQKALSAEEISKLMKKSPAGK